MITRVLPIVIYFWEYFAELIAGMDVVMQILDEFKTWRALPKKTHIHSHQRHLQKLTWDKELNDRADELATEHLSLTEPTSLIVPFPPASKVQLSLNQSTVTHHYHLQIHFLLPDWNTRNTSRNATIFKMSNMTILTSQCLLLSKNISHSISNALGLNGTIPC